MFAKSEELVGWSLSSRRSSIPESDQKFSNNHTLEPSVCCKRARGPPSGEGIAGDTPVDPFGFVMPYRPVLPTGTPPLRRGSLRSARFQRREKYGRRARWWAPR